MKTFPEPMVTISLSHYNALSNCNESALRNELADELMGSVMKARNAEHRPLISWAEACNSVELIASEFRRGR